MSQKTNNAKALIEYMNTTFLQEINELEKKHGSVVANQAVTQVANAISFAMGGYRNPEKGTYLHFQDGVFQDIPKKPSHSQ